MADDDDGGGKLSCVDHGPLNEGAVGKMTSEKFENDSKQDGAKL